jgi:hypothetical protein
VNTLITIIKLLPLIIELVRSLEGVIPQSGQGKVKLAIAQEVLDAAYDEGGSVSKDMPKEKWLTIATNLICKIVGIFNAHGIFRSAASQAG